MFTKFKQTVDNEVELGNFIEGFDIYNSRLLELLNDSTLPMEAYTINVGENRPDIIAKKFYGDYSYQAYVILQCYGINDLKIGSTIYLIEKEYLNNLINQVTNEYDKFK